MQQTLSDKEQIEQLHYVMYKAMVSKDRKELERVHADGFYLLHMTGMKQCKADYINSIMNGTLNYYDGQTEHLDVQINGDKAVLISKSRVTAAVFGGGIHTWRLQLKFTLAKTNNEWKFTSAKASTY